MEIPEEYPLLSNHELIIIEWEDIYTLSYQTQASISGWIMKILLKDEKLLETVKDEWNRTSGDHQLLSLGYTRQELDQEVEWFEKKLTKLLNNHAKITQITSYSKQ